MTGIYAIYDKKAEANVGILQTHSHEAVAIRVFGDITTADRNAIKDHPEDYDLVRLGYLQEDNKTITPDYQLVITGTAIMARLNQQQNGT